MSSLTTATQSPPGESARVTQPVGLNGIFLPLSVLVFLLFTVWYSGLIGAALQKAPHNDFGRFYLSARAHLTGSDLYAWNEAIPAELPSRLDGRIHSIDLWNMNPPHFHLLVLPVALLPAPAAFVVWTAGGLIALAFTLRLVVNELDLNERSEPRLLVLFALLAGVATPVTLVTGQVSWYLLLPVTLIWVHARRGAWTKAGIWLGIAAAWKPFLLILVPYFALQRQWKSLVWAAAMAVASLLFGLMVFGVETHRSWIEGIGQSENWAWLHINAGLWGFLTRCGTVNPLYAPVIECSPLLLKLVWLALGGAIGLTSLAIAAFDRSRLRIDRAFAVLLAAAFLICPLGWNYYWFLVLGPVMALAFCARDESSPRMAVRTVVERLLLCIAVVGFFVPVRATQILPGPFTTLTLGSVYFWTTLAFWSALVLEGYRQLGRVDLRNSLRSFTMTGVSPKRQGFAESMTSSAGSVDYSKGVL